MLKFVIVLLVCALTLPQNAISNDEVSVFDMVDSTKDKAKSQNGLQTINIQAIAPTDEPTNIDDSDVYQPIEPSTIDLNISQMPESVYIHQVFSVDFTVNTKQNLTFDLNLDVNASDITWLNPKPTWKKNDNGIYSSTLWFEANSTQAKFNEIKLTLNRNSQYFQDASINPPTPLINDLTSNDNFSNTVCDSLEIKKIKASKFDDNFNIINIELQIKNGNLGSFYIPGDYLRQGMESVKGSYLSQTGNYFIVADKNISNIKFSYYSLQDNKFHVFDMDFKVQDDILSTQVDLNPKESEFEIYKDIFMYSLIAIFILIFVFKRSYYSLVISIALIAYAFYSNKPFSNAILKENSEVKILPTHNSSIFFISKKEENVKVMAKKDNYTKIMLENKKIGWVKDENLQ